MPPPLRIPDVPDDAAADASPEQLFAVVARTLAGASGEWSELEAALVVVARWLPADRVRYLAPEELPHAGAAPAGAIELRTRGALQGHLVVEPHEDASVAPARRATLERLAPLFALAADRLRLSAALTAEADGRRAQLAAQEQLTACILDSLPLGIHVVDRSYRVRAWNRERERGEQGVARGDAIGRPIFDVLHRQPADALRREFDEVFERGQLQQYESETVVAGTTRRYRLTKIPMRLAADGPVTHVITVGEDVTEQAATRERIGRAEKLAAVGRLAAGVMHEVNNPLATIAACGEMLGVTLGEAAGEPQTARLLDIIEQEVQRCTRIVRGLLDFARPGDAARAPADVNAIARHALLLAAHHPRASRVRLDARLCDEPLVASVNGDQLVQVLLALLMNAMDASPEQGTVTLRSLRTRAADGRDVTARLDVIDEGPGIPPSLQPRLFEPFYTTKPPGEGTGLGLAIAWGLVREHGGELGVVSDPAASRGATFTVTLPLVGARLAPSSDAAGRSAGVAA